MSFDQDPNEQADISGANLAILIDERAFLKDMLTWAYSKIQHGTFSNMEDAMMADAIKLYIEHGIMS